MFDVYSVQPVLSGHFGHSLRHKFDIRHAACELAIVLEGYSALLISEILLKILFLLMFHFISSSKNLC